MKVIKESSNYQEMKLLGNLETFVEGDNAFGCYQCSDGECGNNEDGGCGGVVTH